MGGSRTNKGRTTMGSTSNKGRTKKRSSTGPGFGLTARRVPAPNMGAVRLIPTPKRRFKHVNKASMGVLAIISGILVTSQSNGTVEDPVPSMPTFKALIAPTFFFNDRDNALGDQQQLLAGTNGEPQAFEQDTINEQQQPVQVAMLSSDYAPSFSKVTTPTGIEGMLAGRTRSIDLSDAFTAEMPAETHAGESAFASVDATATQDTTPKTTSVSPLANHPAIANIRRNTEFPEGAVKETVTVASGDSLSKILNDRGVKIEQMPQLLTDEVVKKHLSNLRIGQTFDVVRLSNGDFHSLSARVGNDRHIAIRRSAAGFAVASIDLPVEKERVVTSGTIEQSLFVAAEQADLNQSTIMELSDIFQWELDFARDIRKGDQFSLIYDRLYREGKYIGDGDILAAEFVRGGKHYQAIRYTSPDGETDYYAPNGQSKRRTFLRHPVDVVRITSRFDPKRVHPVLHQIRAHKGVDYGSPSGTPIRATANGVVKFAGSKSAYGKTVILSHGTDIRTLYAHMSRISNKVSNGKRVKQGDVIGYVGATGRVTGAHLHYEFQKKGKHVDPLKVELPAAQPLKAELRDELRALSEDLLAQMRSVLPTENEQVAKASTESIIEGGVAQ